VPLSREYFDAVEAYRYQSQPDIFGFAQFTRYHGKRVLEIGVGSGTDFLQWVRAGAEAYGVDLTQAAIETTKAHLKAYGLSCADLRTADAQALPFEDNKFDLVYSWGVLHHTPDTLGAIGEAVRVTKPGGTVKLMLYNRHSITAIKTWIRFALLKGKPFRSFADVLYHYMESISTEGQMLMHLPVRNIQLDSSASAREFGPAPDDSLKRRLFFFVRYALVVGMGLNGVNFFMKIRFDKMGKA
jgi:SAM-dependent methyltransferase